MVNKFLKKGFTILILFLFIFLFVFPSYGFIILDEKSVNQSIESCLLVKSINDFSSFKSEQFKNFVYTTQYGNINLENSNYGKNQFRNQIPLSPIINFPYEGEVFRLSDYIEINGTTSITGFENYIIEWGEGRNPSEWYTEGITLIDNGNTDIENGTLGFWDSAVAAETDYYSLRLTVFISGPDQYLFDVSFYLDSTLHPNFPFGWPYDISGSQVAIWSPIALSDINNDGYEEIGFGTVTVVPAGDNNKDFVIDSNGNILYGWPINFYGIQGSALTFSDIDILSNNIEIIGGMWGTQLFVWQDNGTIVEGWPRNMFAARASATVNDIDSDGDLEIILPSTDGGGYIYAWHDDGTLVDGWPVYIGSPVRRAASTADIDNDSYPEILFGDQNGYFYVLNHDGSVLEGWPQQANDWIKNSPVIADIQGDGDLEIIIGSGFTQKRMIFVWNHDGTVVDGWPQENGLPFVQPSVADIDKDGDLEILAGGSVPNKPYARFFVWHHNGELVDGWPIEFEYDPQQDVDYIYAQPVIGDIDGDNDVEIIVGSYNDKLYAWHHDATNVNGWPKIIGDSVDSTAAIGDIDQDNLIEVVVAGDDGKVYAWDMEGQYISSNLEWPMFQHDIHHTGCYHTKIQKNQPPDIPDILGPTNGASGDPIVFSFNAIDPEEDDIKYHIDWGDDNTVTTIFYPSGESIDLSHIWRGDGEVFKIKAKAEDTNGLFSDQGTFDITIPRNRIRFCNIFNNLTNLIRILNLFFN